MVLKSKPPKNLQKEFINHLALYGSSEASNVDEIYWSPSSPFSAPPPQLLSIFRLCYSQGNINSVFPPEFNTLTSVS